MTPANGLTLFRLICAPIVFALCHLDTWWPALAVYMIGLVTDALDGRIARATHTTTSFGRAMDSTSDKALVVGAMLGLVANNRLSVWFAFAFILREFAVFGLRAIRTPDGSTVAEIADSLGRFRFLILHIGMALLLTAIPLQWIYPASITLIAIATALSYASLIYYLNRDWTALYATMKRKASQ